MKYLYLVSNRTVIYLGNANSIAVINGNENIKTIVAWSLREVNNTGSIIWNEWENHIHVADNASVVILDRQLDSCSFIQSDTTCKE